MSSPTEAPRPKAVLVGVQLPGVTDAEQRSSLMELGRLCKTLGFEVVGEVTQKRKGLGAATLVGEGKLVELAAWTGGTGVVPKGPPGKKKATEEDEEEDETEPLPLDAPPAPTGEPAPPSSSSTTSCRLASSATSSRDLGRGGPRSHRRDHRDLPPARVEPTGAPAGRDRAAHVCGPPVARDRRWRAPARRHRAEGRGESSVELDRRKIRDRISELKTELAAIDDESKTRRARRQEALRVALVGTPTRASRR